MARLLVAALLVTVLGAPPAAADWIVTRDGEEIETDGPWREQGRLLVLTLAETGDLVSMRASDVDLPASRALTEERAAGSAGGGSAGVAEADAKSAPVVESVIVLTDADFTRRSPVTTVPEADDETAGPGEESADAKADAPASAPTPASEAALTVVEWEDAVDPEGGVTLAGRLVNRSRGSTASGVTLNVKLYDTEGELLAERAALLSTQALQPGDQSSFQVSFPEVELFAAVKFEATSQLFSSAADTDSSGDDG